MRGRRRWTTVAATVGMLGALVGPAQAASQAEVLDPAGDFSRDGDAPPMTAAQGRAIDVARGSITLGNDSLVMTVSVQGNLADRRVDQESGTFMLLWQGGDPTDPENLWVFGLLDTGPEYFALYEDPDGELGFGFSESCAGWSASESGSTATYQIAYTCLPGARSQTPLHWAVAAGTGDDSGNSWSDFGPDDDGDGTPVSAPAVDFPAGSNFERPTPVARDITDTCDGRAPQTTFDDTSGNVHEGAINCLSHYGITQGTGGGNYSPTFPLSKGQTATFLVRTLGVAEIALSEPGDACDDAGAHADSLERLIASGIIDAPTARNCGEIDAISRAEMARWVQRSLTLGGVSASDVTDWYIDDEGHVDEVRINEITSIGVVTGSGGARFLPDATLSRAQMATFLARTLDALFNAQAP